MRISLAIVDQVRPAVAAWLKEMTPTGLSVLRRASNLLARGAVANMPRQLRRRTGPRLPFERRAVRVRIERRVGGHPFASISWAFGIAAALELGATIPAVTLRPWRRTVLAWGGPPGGKQHTAFSRGHTRPAFTLRRRPMLEPAYQQNEAAVLAMFDEAYEKTFAAGSTATAIRERIGG
jgi:hypothetical protein